MNNEQPQTPEPSRASQTPQMSQAQKPGSSPVLWIIIIIVLVVIVGLVAWYFLAKSKSITTKPTETTPIEVTPTELITDTSVKTGVEINYEKAISVEPVAGRCTEVNTELLPILKKIFPEGVKLTEASQGWLTYNINRVLTANDIKSVRTELEVIHYTIDSIDEKGLSASKGAQSITIEFNNIDDKNKAEVSVYW